MIDYGLADMEPKSERMSLPQWDGDPSGWRDYQQEVRLYKTSENLEVNWSVAARLVGGLRGAARRVGLAMTDQELLPTARNITDNLERKADRNRRGIEALMTRLEAELGQQRPQKKGESLEMFFVSNKLQRKRGERITDYITRFEEGIKTLQDNDINLLTIDDVPPRYQMNISQSMMSNVFWSDYFLSCTPTNIVSLMGTHDWTLVSVSEKRTNVVPTSLPQCPRDWSRVGRHRQC